MNYKVDINTKTGREINLIINNYSKIYNIFKNNKKTISFMTNKNMDISDYNIEIFEDDRINRLALGNSRANFIAMNGCITTSLKQYFDFFRIELEKKEVNIFVSFGKRAASSRIKKDNNIKKYKPNSHKQIEEIKNHFNINNLNFIHNLNLNKEKTIIKVGDKSLEIDTVNATAFEAIKIALLYIGNYDIMKLLK